MIVKVIAFGIARDILGANSHALEVNAGMSVSGVLEVLKSQFPDFEKLASLRMAVNESYVENDYEIKSGDELVLIPPVSGG